jgi:PAS domain S-box-containing protein
VPTTLADLSGALDGLVEGFAVLDRDFRYLVANGAAARLARVAPGQLIGRTIMECIPGIEHTSLFATLRECMTKGTGAAIDSAFTFPDGAIGHYEVRLQPLPAGLCMVWSDTTARQHSEILEAAPDAMVIVDDGGHITLANAQTEKLFGYSRAELIGRSVEILLPERARGAHVMARARYAGEPRLRAMGSGLELAGRRRDGTEFPVEIGLSPLGSGRGSLVAAAIRDITERKRAEHAAKVAHERLVSALESFQDAFALFDADDRLVLCNSTFRSFLPTHWSLPAVGTSFESILEGEIESIEIGEGSLDEYRARRRSYHVAPQGAIDVRTRDGRSLRIHERITPEGGRVTTITDLTDDVRRENDLREARNSAETANAAKSEFLRSMSHELRTPLNAVLGFAQLLQRDKALGDRSHRLVDHVLKGGEHLLRLIDDVLDLARVESGAVPLSLEPVGVREVLDEVVSTLAPMAQRRQITLAIVAADPAPAAVRADRTRLVQIVLNFGSNAIKYGRQGGHVRLRASPHGEHLRIAVADDGPGIPRARQDRLFSAFYRAGQETGPIEGTGIGLALTQRLATMMEGSVGFESTEGVGSTFWVDLPAARLVTPTLRSEGPPRDVPLPPARGVSILYVEDNPANLAFMEELVATMPSVTLLHAPTGEIGVELARAHRPALVLLDINLPGISGFEVLRRLRELPETRSIPVIALSASAMERDVRRAHEAGFTRYLTKPVKVDMLTGAIEEILSACA